MKKTIKSILLVVLFVLSTSLLLLAAACGEKFVDQGEVGSYYSSALEDNVVLTLDENKFTLQKADGDLGGSYTFDGTTLVITFDGEKSGVTVSLGDNVINFAYKNHNYILYKDVNYTVGFDTNGGSTISSQQVRNGQKITAPAEPTKDGYTFIGWYKDSSFKNVFDFDSNVVLADQTIYAYFVENTSEDSEFDVFFVSNEDSLNILPVKTLHNTIYNLPEVNVEGKTFLGWWVSDYDDPEKLTYQYKENMVLSEMTTLYAVYSSDTPAVSVNNGKISWDSKGANRQYAVNVWNLDADDDALLSRRVTTTSVDFDFANQVPGNYLVEVQVGDYTGKAYYINYGLDRVSNFKVEGNVVTWNKVANATNYLLTVDCALAGHEHTNLDLGNVNYYDFGSCFMKPEGIEFTITATATGYESSTSYPFEYYRELEKVTNIKVGNDNQSLVWDPVDNATSYKVTITDADANAQTYVVTGTSISIGSYAGNISYNIVPQGQCYFAYESTGSYNKESLRYPTDVNFAGYTLSWGAVENAVSYNIKVGNLSYTSTTNSIELEPSVCDSLDSFVISIQAIASDSKNNSLFSNEITVGKTVQDIKYSNGVITWNAVAGSVNFFVKIDDSEPVLVENSNSLNQVIKSGDHTISVVAANSNNQYNANDFYTSNVRVYELIFDVAGGREMESYYYVLNDTISNLPTPHYEGFTFVNWYADKDLREVFTKDTFDTANDITIYASWAGLEYTVTYDYASYGTGDVTTQTVRFGSPYKLAVAESTDDLKVFIGWYSELNMQGEKYTDEQGNSLLNWRDYKDVTLYAGYADIFAFNPINNGTAYSVSKGSGIGLLSEITIPATYNGLPVTTVESGAFLSCSNLITVNIPNSIKNVEIGSDGPNGTGSAFQSCSNLRAVNIYPVEGVIDEDIYYYSIDGVLIYRNQMEGGYEIKYFPYNTKGGVYTIPSIVTTIPINAFKSCNKVEEIIVPATVTKINDTAFSSCSKLTRITFLEAENSDDEQELQLGKEVFKSNSSLIEVTLPARIASFNATIFTSCSKLEAIHISGEYEDAKYKSYDGVVLTADGSELVFCPRGRTGEYTIPVGVSVIGESAFQSCTKLTKITISGQVRLINKLAFKGCTGVAEVVFEGQADDVPLTICEQAFYGLTNTDFEEIYLPKNLVAMEQNAFGGCSKLVKAYVTSVAENISFAINSFANTTTSTTAIPTFYITDLWISKDVHEFDITGVFGASKLMNVEIEEGNKNYASVDGVLYDAAITQVLYYPTERQGDYDLPNTIERIGARVFQSKTGITSITFPKTIVSIGEGAFQSCTNLVSITFVEGGTEPLVIEAQAFQSCSKLVNVVLPARTVSIGNSAFKACTKIEEMIIPENVKTIGDYAFQTCTSMKTISFPAGLETLVASQGTTTSDTSVRTHVLDNTDALLNVFVGEGNPNYSSVNGVLYANEYDSEGELLGKNLIVFPAGKTGSFDLPNDIVRISGYAFYEAQIEEINFPQGISGDMTIDSYAFYYSSTLKKIQLPEGLKTLSENAVYYCRGLEQIVFPSTLTYIGSRSFYYATALKSVIFTEGGTEELVIGDGKMEFDSYGGTYYYGVFYSSNNIETLVLPERLKVLGAYSFAGLSGLKTVVLPSTVETIKTAAFRDCQALSSITLTADAEGKTRLQSIGEYAFYKNAITSIDLPDGIKTLENDVFYYCSNLQTITIPKSLESIGNYTFGYTALRRIEFPAGSQLKTIGNSAFVNCKNLKEVIFPEDSILTTIGNNAFNSCTSLESFAFPQSIEVIDYRAFASTKSLKSVTFVGSNTEEGSHLKQIGYYCFISSGLETFAFPYCGKDDKGVANKISFIIPGGGYVNIFESCKNLTEVYLSEAITSIDKLFVKCPALKKITVSSNSENFKVSETAPIILNLNGDAIQFAFGRITDITIPEGITSIGSYAFSGQTDIKTLVLPKTLKTIEPWAFFNCVGLETLTFAEGSVIDKISEDAFKSCKSLKTVILPNSVTKIDKEAFLGCTSLENITLSSNLKEIGQSAFAQTTALKSITFPASLQTIGQYAFKFSGLESVVFNEGLKSLGQQSFEDCENIKSLVVSSTITTWGNYPFRRATSLTDVTLPAGITKLSQGMFSYCSALESITLPDSITYFPTYVFEYCDSLKSITLPANLVTIGGTGSAITVTGTSYAFQYCTNLEEVICGNKLAQIGGYAFRGCESLKSITFPSSLKIIANYAFIASGLESVTIPDSVTALGSAAGTGHTFQDCVNLKTVKLSSKLTSLYGYVFSGCSSLEEISIPSTVTTLGNYVFQNCTSLTKATILSKPTTVGTYLFAGCSALADVTMNSASTKVGNYMFQNCTSLESFTIPSTVTALGTYMFEGCTSLKSLEIPSKITTITTYLCRNCTSLETFKVLGKVTTINTYAFDGCTSLKNLDLSAAATTLKTLNTYMFRNCTSLESIAFPSTVTSINNYMFYGCTNLKSVSAPGVTTIGTYAFYNCESLTDVSIPKMTSIGDYAFYGCSSLSTIVLPESLTKFGIASFMNSGLKTLVIPSKCSSSGGSLFNGCSGLTLTSNSPTFFVYNNIALIDTDDMALVSVFNIPEGSSYVIPDDVALFRTYALRDVSQLVRIEIPEGVTEIPNYAFQNCVNLVEVVLPSTITKIGSYAFDGCENLTTINLPEGLQSIGSYAFQNCSLTGVEFPSTLTKIDLRAFLNNNLTEVILPEGMTNLGEGVFRLNKSLTKVYVPSTLTSVSGGSGYTTSGAITSGGIFAECTSLTDVTLAEGLAVLGSYMFDGDTALETIVIPASLDAAFIGTSTTSNGQYAFRDCTNLKNVTLNDAITTIPTGFFYNCTGLTSITFPKELTKISAKAFMFSGLTEAILPQGLTTIQEGAFRLCHNLTKAYLPTTLTSTAGGAGYSTSDGSMTTGGIFAECENLSEVILPEGLTVLGTYMFSECNSLKTIDIPSTVSVVTNNCFRYNTGIEEVILHEGTTEIAYQCFYGCSNLSKIVLPESIATVAYASFYGCVSIKKLVIPFSAIVNGNTNPVNATFGLWTSDQLVVTTASLFDITGSWGETVSYLSNYGYWSNTDATFVFEYSEEESEEE